MPKNKVLKKYGNTVMLQDAGFKYLSLGKVYFKLLLMLKDKTFIG